MAKHDFTTGVGRLVQGDAFKPNETDMYGKPLVNKAGQPRQEWYIAVAFSKTDPEEVTQFGALWQKMQAAAMEHPQYAAVANRFNYKMMDGDAAEYAAKPGFKGCWVVKFKNGYQPTCWIWQNGQYVQITDPTQLKRGYFVRVMGDMETNGDMAQPSNFMNWRMIQLVAFGEEIAGGPSPDQAFGGMPAGPLPAGASQTPMAGGGNSAPPMAGGYPAANPGYPAAAPAGVPAGNPAGLPPAGLPGQPPMNQQYAAQPGQPAPQQYAAQPGQPAPQQYAAQPGQPAPQQYAQAPTPQQYAQAPAPQQYAAQPGQPAPQQYAQAPAPQQYAAQPAPQPQYAPQGALPGQQPPMSQPGQPQYAQQPGQPMHPYAQ